MNNPQGYLEVDMELVKRRLIEGCSGPEIAAELGVSSSTLSRHCLRETGIHFSKLKLQYRAKGDNTLRSSQYKKAVVDKDTSMLIFLGKNRLNQSERAERKNEDQLNVASFLKALKKIDPSAFENDIENEFEEDDEDYLDDI